MKSGPGGPGLDCKRSQDVEALYRATGTSVVFAFAIGKRFAVASLRLAAHQFRCAALVQWIANMKQPLRPEDPSPSLQTLQTRRLIADIKRIVDILNSDIANEEALAGISDPSRSEYPILARALAARRANLQSTMASLERLVPDSSFAPSISGEPVLADDGLVFNNS